MEPVTQAILNVLTIIALIAAIAFIIIILVDLVLSITNKRGSIFFRGRGDGKDTERPKVLEEDTIDQQPIVSTPVVIQSDNQPIRKTWDEMEAEREQQSLLDNTPVDQPKDFTQERQESIERRRREFEEFDTFNNFEEEKMEQSEPEPEPAKIEEYNFDEMINEINSESVTKYQQSETNELIEEIEEEEIIEDEGENLLAEPEKTEEPEVVTIIEPEPEPQPEPEIVHNIIGVYDYMDENQLQARLEKLQQRLKVNERDLRANKKEYNPLARVKRSLERDQKKLRRREAIVAKRKVELYGVNNYVDIDEEKAKKLSEDLDLLDGLRLSVQHCEEVMEQNKERFPVLEKANQILVEQNKQIKEDIAEVMAAIEKSSENN